MAAPLAQRVSSRNECLQGARAILLGLGFLLGGAARGADLDEVEGLFRSGRYGACAKAAAGGAENFIWGEQFSRLKIESELALGKYAEALASLEQALRRAPASLPLHLLARTVYRYNGRAVEAEAEMAAMERLILGNPQRYANAEGRVALGRFFLLRGADARKVLDQFYDVVTRNEPDEPDGFLATAELALQKQDQALAAETLEKAPRAAAEDPHFHYLLARAFEDGDRARAEKELEAALKINPSHVDSLLLQADHRIDDERYEAAEGLLQQALQVNPAEPRAWAYRAVLAHLRSDPAGEDAARGKALAHWAKNPEVDHLIGRKLSQKYRFAEGSSYQKRALRLDGAYLPARVQLCQDLLRLGDEDAGWKLAAEVFDADGYNVVAYNLVTLRDRLAGFRTLEAEGLVVRMDPREADLYGARVLDLLGRARKTLGERYGVTLEEPVIVEIFPQRKEFAVRTFGLPGADGLLGVCFGNVVTANSPASQGEHPSNWEAVLWHEFCHVVTLTKTRNKMPRWLSEGISVYEEERADKAWGESWNPHFRAMVLGEELTPLSRLSSAFLAPKSGMHLQFAYFESALAVDFLVRRAGLPALKGLLDDLGAGVTINVALPRRAKTSLEELDRDFARFARERAGQIAPQATWDEPDLPADAASEALEAWLKTHPQSFAGRRRLAARLVAEQKWARAREVLEPLRSLYPEYVGAENAYVLLATVYRNTNDPAAERRVLEELAARDGDALEAYRRLMELDAASHDWRGLAAEARRMLAVNPVIAEPHRQLARASEELGHRADAIASYRALVLLDDSDPAGLHYRLARLLAQEGRRDEARREALKSLEEAPRFLDSHRLLLELVDAGPRSPSKPDSRPEPEPKPSPKPAASRSPSSGPRRP